MLYTDGRKESAMPTFTMPPITPTIFGDAQPVFDVSDIQQTYTDTCAIKSQQLILNTFGVDVSEDTLVQDALNLHIYQPGQGTPIDHMGDLLELHGIGTTMFESANKYTLMHELAQGHQVIVAVDSGELWVPSFLEKLKDFFLGSTPNHALIVTGVDASDPTAIDVIITDPGTGNVTRYPYDQFADAWADSSFTMVATNDAPTEITGGILPQIMGMDTNEWLSSFGDVLEQGVEVASNIVDFLQANPEVITAAGKLVTVFLANNADAAEAAGMDITPYMSDMA